MVTFELLFKGKYEHILNDFGERIYLIYLNLYRWIYVRQRLIVIWRW